MALAIRQEELRLEATIKPNLKIRERKFNEINTENLGQIEFNGSAEDCYEIIEYITLIARSRNWPGLEEKGSSNEHFGGTAQDATVAAWNTANPQIAAEAAGRSLTQIEKDTIRQGLYHRQTWKWTTYAVINQTAAGAGGLGIGSRPPIANISYANIDLDGIELVEGRIVTAGADDVIQTTRSELRGRFATANGTTTLQHQPINDCRRSKKIIDVITQRFTGTARKWWMELSPEELPRTLFNHRWEGQEEDVNGDYGLFAKMKRAFIHPMFKAAKYRELQTLRYENYPLPVSKMTGREEPRSMMSFNRWWKMALWICDIKFGSPINQREEYNRRIPQNIVFSLNQWMTFNNIVNPSMEEYYAQAITCQAQLTTQGMSLTKIMPLTTQRSTITQQTRGNGIRRMRGSTRPIRNNRFINNIEEEEYDYDHEEYNQEELSEMESHAKQLEINAIQRNNSYTQNNKNYGFYGNVRKSGSGNQFRFSGSAIPKSNITCYACGNKGHYSNECKQGTNVQRRNTTSMNRNNSRVIKGQNKINNQNQRNKNRNQGINNIEYYNDQNNTQYEEVYNTEYGTEDQEYEESYDKTYGYTNDQNNIQYEEVYNTEYGTEDQDDNQFDEYNIIEGYAEENDYNYNYDY